MREAPVVRECFLEVFAYHDAATGGTLNAAIDRTTLMDLLTDSLDAASSCGGGTLGFRKLVIFRKAPKTPPVLTWDALGSDCQYLFYIPLHSLRFFEKKTGATTDSILELSAICVRMVDAPYCYRP